MDRSPTPEHGPGPPTTQAGRDVQNTDDQHGLELQNKEEELQRLKSEMQNYVGKLRGYETLGQLYHESKQECMTFKQKNEQLAHKLDVVMKQLMLKDGKSSTKYDDENSLPAEAAGQQSPEHVTAEGKGTFSAAVGEVLHDIELRRPESYENVETEKQVGETFDFKSEKDHPMILTPSRSAASFKSSSSVVEINSSFEAATPDAIVSGELPQSSIGDGKQQSSLNRSAEMGHVSMELQHVIDQMKIAGQQDLSSDLIRSSLSVLKLEKQSRLQKAMMEQMSSKLNELQRKVDSKNHTIKLLQDDRAKLASIVKQLESSRAEALREARPKYMEVGSNKDEGSSFSGDWVEVEKPACTGDTGKEGGSDDDVQLKAVSTTEMELRRRIDKLNTTVCELVSVNRSWDEHCLQREASHSQELSRQNEELVRVRTRLHEAEQNEQQKQQEFDQLLINAKKQREAEEMAKEEALRELHLEKRRCAEFEDQCIEFSRKTAELENRIYQQQNAKHSELLRSEIPPQSMSRQNSLVTELQVMREQVGVFKEDFEQERRDREAARATSARLQTKLDETKEQLEFTRSRLFKALDELKQSRNENAEMKNRFQKAAEDLRALQSQMRPPQHGQPSQSHHHARPPMHQFPARHLATHSPIHSWICQVCTFNNPGQRLSCEICGNVKDRLVLQPRGREMMSTCDDDVLIAGLSAHHHPPTARSLWPPLANANLETDADHHHESNQ